MADAQPKQVVVLTRMLHHLHGLIRRGLLRWARLDGGLEVTCLLWDGAISASLIHGQAWDGVITEVWNRHQAGALLTCDLPVVNLCHAVEDLPFATCLPDDAAVARLAFDHLAERRPQHLALVYAEDFRFAHLRRRAFTALAEGAGIPCAEYAMPEAANRDELRALSRWLAALPRPLGVFGVRDVDARTVLDAARMASLAVPDEVQVVGADDDPAICEDLEPSLSSIDLDPARVGEEAGRLVLHMIAHGGRSARSDLRVPPRGLRQRRSSDAVPVEDPAVAAALRHLRDHAHHDLRVPELAAAAGVSRRVLERRMLAVLGRTPADELRRQRLDRARAMLLDTRLGVAAVARACGFPSASHFATCFRQRYGVSPSEVRGEA